MLHLKKTKPNGQCPYYVCISLPNKCGWRVGETIIVGVTPLRHPLPVSSHMIVLTVVGDISLKIWANCANSDTSMKISDNHYDSISFTYGLLAIIFFHFFKMATVFFKMAIFFHTEYTFE